MDRQAAALRLLLTGRLAAQRSCLAPRQETRSQPGPSEGARCPGPALTGGGASSADLELPGFCACQPLFLPCSYPSVHQRPQGHDGGGGQQRAAALPSPGRAGARCHLEQGKG